VGLSFLVSLRRDFTLQTCMLKAGRCFGGRLTWVKTLFSTSYPLGLSFLVSKTGVTRTFIMWSLLRYSGKQHTRVESCLAGLFYTVLGPCLAQWMKCSVPDFMIVTENNYHETEGTQSQSLRVCQQTFPPQNISIECF
jgi:hypothetical protein